MCPLFRPGFAVLQLSGDLVGLSRCQTGARQTDLPGTAGTEVVAVVPPPPTMAVAVTWYMVISELSAHWGIASWPLGVTSFDVTAAHQAHIDASSTAVAMLLASFVLWWRLTVRWTRPAGRPIRYRLAVVKFQRAPAKKLPARSLIALPTTTV